MKCRFTVKSARQFKATNQNGIALVITLVMLAIVTVMAIVFLAVTRRERSSVIVTEETAVAKDMADAALERVKSEALARMNANGARLYYDLFNSQAYYNPAGFDPSRPQTNTNVAPISDWPRIRQNSESQYLELLANLQHDPAVPVFVETNRNGDGDLRYYLDFNRNRQFETNGLLFDYDLSFDPITTTNLQGEVIPITNRFVGDPEWIGVLERPDYPHSETNRFVGRYAYLALPAGKSLDLNFIHNQLAGSARLNGSGSVNGFSRSQGVGSWEINLAAFLRELNGNAYAWGDDSTQQGYEFDFGSGLDFVSSGKAFDDARSLLGFRLMDGDGVSSREYLMPMYETLGVYNMLNPKNDPNAFRYVQDNLTDDFGNRVVLPNKDRVFFPPNVLPGDDDNQSVKGWPGSPNTNAFTDLQQLFSVDATSQEFVARLQRPSRLVPDGGIGQSGRSSYDRYTFYRLAAQLGTDSVPATDGKIHLNFKNPVGMITNVTERWFENPTNAIMFFTNAADLMLRASIDGTITISNNQQVAAYQRPVGTYYIIGDTLVRTDFSMTNILVFSTNLLPGVVINEYTPTIHRILQVAANIYDSMTNKEASLPSVFMPMFTNFNNNLYIWRFVELTNNADSYINGRSWITPDAAVNPASPLRASDYNIYGQHAVVGAKKGHPNFNELALNTQLEFSRKLRLTKNNPSSTNIVATNQMFLMNLHQRWGMEGWNSYLAKNDRPMTIRGQILSTVALRDGTNLAFNPVFMTNLFLERSTNLQSWQGRRRVQTMTADPSFLIQMDQKIPLIGDRSYSGENNTIPRGPGRFRGTNDYSATLDLPPEFIVYTTNRVAYWVIDERTKRLVDFVSFDRLITETDTRNKLRQPNNLALGTNVSTINYWDTNLIGGGPLSVGVSNQLAVSVGAATESKWNNYRWVSDRESSISKFRVFIGQPDGRTGIDTNVSNYGYSHQAPFTPTRHIVHAQSWQVNDPLVHYMFGDLRVDRLNAEPKAFDAQVNETNWNIGHLNHRIYHPWSGGTNDQFAYNVGLMDPGIRSSDHWEFLPMTTENINHFPNIGSLGQIHRGTPWQTIYLKSFYREVNGTNDFFAPPSLWYNWAGTMGTHPTRDWRLLDVFTTAANENAARGLLSVNQTNTAAWSAVLSGTIAAVNDFRRPRLSERNSGIPKEEAYRPEVIDPATPEIAEIVRSINNARTNQQDIIRNPNPNANKNTPFITILRTNSFVQRPADVFRTMGEVLSAPALSVQSPFLKRDALEVQAAWTDRAVEYIPQQILSLLQKDEPRFVVYAFGQSLKPAPRSLTTDPGFYHMCTNYQITGEVITKTTFRVEGRPRDPNDPLRPVVEKYEILPPWE